MAVLPNESVTVSVKPLTFEYGVQYQMKVEGGAGTTGNYQALDLATMDHSACGYPVFTEPGQSGGADYNENIVGNTDIVMHINDYVTTLPGNKVGPTGQGIDERLHGHDDAHPRAVGRRRKARDEAALHRPHLREDRGSDAAEAFSGS